MYNKYITNKELLTEIMKCKNSFCSFVAPEHVQYDVVVVALDEITQEKVQEVIAERGDNTSPVVVFRVMTDTHLPPMDNKKRRKLKSGELARINFLPFRHYVLQDDGTLLEVGRSHWKGDFETGYYNLDHGTINNRLATMFMLLVEQYATLGSWRNYSYNDEMKSHALVQLTQVGLQFDETRFKNAFAWYTEVVKNCFRRILHVEKKSQQIRDDLLIMAGSMPSYTRQVDNEIELRYDYSGSASKPAKRGRKPKAKID